MKPSLKKLLIQHEGLRLKPYVDSLGHPTIGVGHKIRPITHARAMELLQQDVDIAIDGAMKFRWFPRLSLVRQDVIISMIFNMGLRRFKTFKRMIAALRKDYFCEAANELLDSLYHVQVGERAEELAEMLRLDVRY
ncbi:hypothetical protein LCGC14_2418120 [marine sediment metagenome]|uniref:Lysozyme n=1 Tax=marine sediment metagenome TaxID=412755 RepID=A0A0F9BQJ8_9ZZZZ